MYNKCKLCNKNIQSADDCKLLLSNSGKIETYCSECFVKKKETR